MLFIVTALNCEAKPLIKHFKLKKNNFSSRFEIYSNQDISLIISGTGLIKSAVATTYLLTCKGYGISNNINIFNLGICGSAFNNIQIGTSILFNKIVNCDTHREFYPDMLIKTALQEGTLHSFSFPVIKNDFDIKDSEFVDMEAAGFFEAASYFISPNNIYCLKTVSDHLDSKRLDPDKICSLIENNVSIYEDIFKKASKSYNHSNDILSEDDYQSINTFIDKYNLSVSMQFQLRDMARLYCIKTGNVLGPFLNKFMTDGVNTKKDGKLVLKEIRRILSGE